MCGRYSLTTARASIVDEYNIGIVTDLDHVPEGPRYNIAPSQPVLAILNSNGSRTGTAMRWGLRPDGSWFNARDDKALTVYRTRIACRRCIVPFDAFYEWRTVGKHKDKYALAPTRQGPHAFAAVYDEAPDGRGVAIFTTEPNALCRWIHNVKQRMPVVLDRAGIDRWLDPAETDARSLAELLRPMPDGTTKAWPVRNATGDNAMLIEPIGAPMTEAPADGTAMQGTLWPT